MTRYHVSPLWLAFGLALGCSDEASSPPTGSAGSSGQAGAPLAGSSGNAGAPTSGGASGNDSGGSATTAGNAGQGVAGSGGSSSGAGGVPSEEGLRVSPAELVFGAVQQTTSEAQTVVLENLGMQPIQLGTVELEAAADSSSFELMAPAPGMALAGGAKLELGVRFHPTGIALFESALVIGHDADGPGKIALFGLGTKGLEGENEPFLKIVLDTLGYDVDVGGSGLLSTTTPLVGSEVTAQRFKAKGATPIELIPVARYSPEEPIPYGFYTTAGETLIGTIANDQYQALNPTLDAGSKLTFEPPAGEFGLYTLSKTHSTYSEDSKNAANQVQHAVRTYPLRDRAGTAIADAYLVCFEEAANGDYQDYVFTLKHVVPVAP